MEPKGVAPGGRLRREISLLGLIAYGVGSILGAGIYTLIGAAAGIANEGLWLAFLLSASIALMTGFSYAELAAMFPRAGAEYHFIRNGFGSPRLGFLTGWLLIAGTSSAVATVALGFGGYLEQLSGIPTVLSAFALIGILSAVNFLGIRESTLVNIGLTLIEVAGLVLIVILGMTRGKDVLVPTLPDEHMGVLSAAALLFFAFTGFEQLANVAEESRAPERMVPIALLGAILISALLYVLVALAVLGLATPQQLANSPAPLALAAIQVLGQFGGILLSVIALFATANTALLLLVASSRLIFGIAREGALPTALTKVNPSTRTPPAAIVLLLILSWAFLPLGQVEVVGSLSSFSVLLVFTLVNLALIRLRYTRPNAVRPFRSPINAGRLPVLAFFGALSTISAAILLSFNVVIVGVLILLAGLIASFVLPARRI